MDPWVGAGRTTGACGSLCLVATQACLNDFFAEDSLSSSAVALRPCSHSDLLCTRLGTLLSHAAGIQLPTSPATTATQAQVDARGHLADVDAVETGEASLVVSDVDILKRMAEHFCAAVGTPLATTVAADATWNMPLSTSSTLHAKCFSGSPRAGVGVPERPQGREDEPVLWYAKMVLDAAYSALASALFRVGLVSKSTVRGAQRGYFTQRGVHAGFGTAVLLLGVLGALGFALCILYMMSNMGAEEAAAMKMARARIQAAEAAEKRSLEQPINTVPEILRAVEQRGGGGWSTQDIERLPEMRSSENTIDSDDD